jgi:hypothetical protein
MVKSNSYGAQSNSSNNNIIARAHTREDLYPTCAYSEYEKAACFV